MVQEINIIEEFRNSSSIHGLSRFGGPEIYTRRRLIWLILVLSAAGALLTFVVFEFVHLAGHPTNTIFTTTIKQEIDFPAVTVCNLNQVKKTVLDCLPDAHKTELTRVFYAFSELSLILQHFGKSSSFKGVIEGSVLHSCALNHSQQLDDMIAYCHFKQELINCSEIFKPKMTEDGLCYTFNSEGQKHVSAVGEGGGLRFFINIHQDQYFFSHTIRAGVKVVLHDPSEEPLPSLRGFLIGPGLSAGCSITKSMVTTLPSPYGSCHEASEKLTGVGTYSELTCYKRCYIDYITSKCSCKHFFSSGDAKFCNSAQLIDCYAKYQNNISKDSEFLKNCWCPPNCKTIKYEPSVSYAAFTSDFIASFLFNQSILPEADYINRNFIDLRLFYNTLIESEVTEVPEKSVGSILGTLGGQMGMFIGASLLSMVELIEFFCLLLTRGTRRVSNAKRQKSETLDNESVLTNGSKF